MQGMLRDELCVCICNTISPIANPAMRLLRLLGLRLLRLRLRLGLTYDQCRILRVRK